MLHPDTLLVGNFNGGIISRSLDGGATWADVNGCSSGCPTGGPVRPGGLMLLPPGHAYAGRVLAGSAQGSTALFSDDRGATWTPVAPGGSLGADAFALLPSGRVLSARVGVSASDDGGESYAPRTLPNAAVEGLAALATPGSTQAGAPSCGLADGALCDGAVAVGYDVTGLYAWRTNDGGRTWAPGVRLPQPNDGIGGHDSVVGLPPGRDGLGRAVAVLGRGIVYATADGAQTWQAVGRLPLDLSGGLHYTWYLRLGPDGHLWVATKRAGGYLSDIYRSAEPATAAFPVTSEAPPAPPAPRLSVEPNPASGRVTVRLASAAPSEARVVVYDALGRQVAVLHAGPLGAGERAFSFEAPAPGVYVVRAGAEARTFTVVR